MAITMGCDDAVKFIYVATKEDRDRMLELGYNMLKADERNSVWVFVPIDSSTLYSINTLTNSGIRFSLSNTLTF